MDDTCHVCEKSDTDRYSFILGHDFYQDIGLDILNSSKSLSLGRIDIKMLPCIMIK